MTLYAVTNGKYSDYHIVGITADRAAAEKYAETRNKAKDKYDDDYRIEEYTDLAEVLDTADKGKKLYQITKNIVTNKIDGGEDKYKLNRPVNLVEKHRRELRVYVWAPDYDEAKKIALDKFNEYEARQKGLC